MIEFLVFLMTFGRFAGAADLDYDIQGNIYVVDQGGNMLVKYSPMGDSLRAVSGFGSGNLQFDEPVAVCARMGNDIYVADYNNHRVQRFNRTLDYITTIHLRDEPDERRRFGYPRDLAITRQGDLLIVDGENNRIVRINSFGEAARTFGDITAGAGRLVEPSRVEVDDRDNVYVLDGNRIVMFDPFGSYLRDVPVSFTDSIRTISVDRDTLAVVDNGGVSLVDLATMTSAGGYVLENVGAVRYMNGRFIAIEPRRGVVYRLPVTEAEKEGKRELGE